MTGKIAARRSPRGSTKKRGRRTREEIKERLLAAAREEFNRKGYAGATTAAIARRAEVAEIQMFRYFPSKGHLFRESVFAQLQEHFRNFNADHIPKAVDKKSIGDRARLYTAELQAFLNDHAKTLISLLFTQTYAVPSLDMSRTGLGVLQAFFDESAAVMSSRAGRSPGVDPGVVVRVAFGALLGCITYRDWLFPKAGANKATIRNAITEFVLAGIGPHSDVGPAFGPGTSPSSSALRRKQ